MLMGMDHLSVNSSMGELIYESPVNTNDCILFSELKTSHPDIICGKTCYDLPVKEISRLSKKIVAAQTGPGAGLTAINNSKKKQAFEPPPDTDVDFIDEDFDDAELESSPYKSCYHVSISSPKTSKDKANNNHAHLQKETTYPESRSSDVPDGNISVKLAGVDNWNNPSASFAYGISSTLYESHPTSSLRAGEPIADAFGICVRENSAILALADGVNWGEKASLASKCAINGCLDYLNEALYHESARVETTMDIFVCLLRSFSAGNFYFMS